MDIARIADLLKPFLERPLLESQLAQISTYIDLLQRWNARINLTAIRDEEEIVTRHFGESLFLARHVFPSQGVPSIARHPERNQGESVTIALAQSRGPYTLHQSAPHVLDVGSGAGFPALPIRIWNPQIQMTMIESNHKKATFLREVTRALTLTNVDVINERAENLLGQTDAHPGAPPSTPSDMRAEVVTLRAVERFNTVLPVAASFVAPGGVLALLIGSAQTAALKDIPLFHWKAEIPVPRSEARILAIGKKM